MRRLPPAPPCSSISAVRVPGGAPRPDAAARPAGPGRGCRCSVAASGRRRCARPGSGRRLGGRGPAARAVVPPPQRADRVRALAEARRVVRPGGPVLTAAAIVNPGILRRSRAPRDRALNCRRTRSPACASHGIAPADLIDLGSGASIADAVLMRSESAGRRVLSVRGIPGVVTRWCRDARVGGGVPGADPRQRDRW